MLYINMTKLFLIIISFFSVMSMGQIQKRVFKFDRYDICEIGPNKVINVSYIIVRHVGHGSVVDGKYYFSRNIKQLKISASITKCARKELLDSCEYVTTITLPNVCSYLAQKNGLMTPMFYAHTPSLTCPLREGPYILSSGMFDPNLMSVIPLENFYWRIEILMFEVGTDEYLWKMCMDGQVIAYRE